MSNETPAPTYSQNLLKHLGDREPLQVMASSAEELTKRVANLSDGEQQTPEAQGKWNIADVVQHLADCEWVLGFRFRQIAAEDNVTLPFFDQDAWARELKYRAIDVQQALEDFRVLRAINLRFIKSVPLEKWSRSGFHPERGNESFEHCVNLYAAHDLAHLAQIERIRASVQA